MKIVPEETKSLTLTCSAVRPWRSEPSNINHAIKAAYHYAKKNGVPMVCIPGNSYMNFVYHIASVDDDLVKYTGMNRTVDVAVVHPNGDVFLAKASKE